MPTRCAVLGCNNESKFPNVSFHVFPRSITMRKVWMRMIGRIDFVPTKNTHVCSVHFREKDIKTETTDSNTSRVKLKQERGKLKICTLKAGAIPCLHMGWSLENVLPKEPKRKLQTPSTVPQENVTPRPTVSVQQSDIQIQSEIDLLAGTSETRSVEADDDDDVVVLDVIRPERNHELTPSVKNEKTEKSQTSGLIPARGTQTAELAQDDYRTFDSIAQAVVNGLKSGGLMPSAAADSVSWLQDIRCRCSAKYKEEMKCSQTGTHVIERLAHLNQMDRQISTINQLISRVPTK